MTPQSPVVGSPTPPAPPILLDVPSKTMTRIPKVAEASMVQKKWNTKNLGMRLASDAVSGIAAASIVAPLITVIDKAIMQNASGQATLKNSLKTSLTSFLLRPHSLIFSKPFALICMVYGGTYLTANALDTITSTIKNKPSTHVTSGTAKFAASSAANISLCIVKDNVFTQLYGSGGPARPVPLPSLALYTLRDCLTIFASFNVPPLLGPVISSRMSEELQKKVKGQTIAQFVAPASVQIISTPLHLLGLDFYNRNQKLSWHDRWTIIKKNWAISAAARICRIVPAFGVGGVVNSKIRTNFMTRLE